MSMRVHIAIALALLAPLGARAQDVPCDSLSEFPCGYQLEDHALQRAPTLFKLQARVAQAGSMIGEAKFTDLAVKLRSGTDVLCTEKFKNVQIRASLMNLEIGHEIDCELDDVLASNGDLNVQLCYGATGESCLPEFPLSSVASVVRATWVWTSERAHRADRAAQAHYTHRFTADRDLGDRETLGTGYFDMETPSEAAAAPLYDAQGFAPYRDGGFLLWTPVRNRQAMTLSIASKSDGDDRLQALDELVFASTLTRTLGRLRVTPSSASGLTVTARGAHVAGDSSIAGDLLVSGSLTHEGTLSVSGNGTVGGTLTVGGGFTVGGGAVVTGASDIDGHLGIVGGADVTGDLQVTGDSSIAGLLVVGGSGTSLTVTHDLAVLGATTAASVHVTGAAEATESLTAPTAAVAGSASAGTLAVAATLDVKGDTLFKGHVTFLGGTARPGNPPNMAYVQSSNEVRDLAFGGPMTLASGAVLGGDLTGALQRLKGARFQLAGTAPGTCTLAAQGLVYFDMSLSLLRMCVNGAWKVLGGGGVTPICGNGFPQGAEACDDGNLASGDGCSATCTKETGFTCTGSPTACTAVCGDGLVVGKEGCDDKNAVASDGCTGTCAVAPGWSCTGTPSTCQRICGDGLVLAGEPCDDGNLIAGDGCSPTCQLEAAWSCDKKQPSKCTLVPLTVAGYSGVAGPDLRMQGLSLCAGAGPADGGVSGVDWLALCDGKGYGEIVFACSLADDATAEFTSPSLPLLGKTLVDAECDDWTGAALWPLQEGHVLAVDALNPACGDYDNAYEMLMHFGTQWACKGSITTPGYLGQTGGRMWAYVRMP